MREHERARTYVNKKDALTSWTHRLHVVEQARRRREGYTTEDAFTHTDTHTHTVTHTHTHTADLASKLRDKARKPDEHAI